ncbi:MAG TPA: DUF6600 domain-containing protein [Thermoanaerobaculia bacterium]|jgi:hypothetical protein
MKTLSRILIVRFALALGLVALAAPAFAETGSYGYFRVVAGTASVMQAGATERASAEVNQPLLAGDHLWVPDRSRVEILLADRNILRVDGGSELILEGLAASPDRDDRATVVRLLEGNLQLVVTQGSLGDELPRVETPRATIYPQTYGVYRVTADHDGWSQAVVRRGTAEVVTDDGSSTVKAGEEAAVDARPEAGNPAGNQPEQIASVREAGGFDSLERWARQLDDDYAGVDQRYVDDSLRYAAAPLARYGEWIDYQGSAYWRPRVEAGWRPYWQGRWAYLPSGLTWISSEPWGWVPYHYGTWDYLPDYGWVWQPGYVYSPAWVYWYWGPSYVGWCPTGYYTHYYAGQFGLDFGFRSGVYGWAGGDWDSFGDWSFVSASYFEYGDGYQDGYSNGYWRGYWDGHRDVRRYAVPIDPLHGVRGALERGVITTDTRPLRPDTWKNPQSVLNALRPRSGNLGELPDVTPFIARKPKPSLPLGVARAVAAENPQVLDGTPLRPGTLGRQAPRVEAGRPVVQGAEPGRSGRPVVVPGGVLSVPGAAGERKPDRAPAAGRPDRGVPNPHARADQGNRPDRPAARPVPDAGVPQPVHRPVVIERPDRTERRPPADDQRRPPEVRERPAPMAPVAPAPRPDRQPQAQERPREQTRPPAPERPREPAKPQEQEKPKERKPPHAA